MKKIRFSIALLALLCLVCALALTACEDETAEDTTHTHAWGEWIEITAPTCTRKGVSVRVCLCGHNDLTDVPELPHTTSAEWLTDGTEHWQICTGADCGAVVNKAAHTPSAAWTSDGTDHWQTCTQAGCTARLNQAAHTPSATLLSDGTHHWRSCTQAGCTAQVSKTTHTPPAEWEMDGVNHWQVCSEAGCGTVVNKAVHAYNGDNVCACSHQYRELGVQFRLRGDSYVVTDFYGTATELIIPAQYRGLAVTRIDDSAFAQCTDLTSIVIPPSVTSIGYCAFENCSSLTSITIPASVTTIGYCAFNACTRLEQVIFEKTDGWHYLESDTATSGAEFFSGTLADPTAAAEYLSSDYTNYYWKRI